MKRLLGGLAALAFTLSVGMQSACAAPGDTVDAEYNFGAGGMNSFTFSAQMGGNAFRQTGEVMATASCEGDPIGGYTYYPLLDYTVFWIIGFNSEGGYIDIRGTVLGTDIAGWAQHINHCAFEDGLYWMSPPSEMQPAAE